MNNKKHLTEEFWKSCIKETKVTFFSSTELITFTLKKQEQNGKNNVIFTYFFLSLIACWLHHGWTYMIISNPSPFGGTKDTAPSFQHFRWFQNNLFNFYWFKLSVKDYFTEFLTLYKICTRKETLSVNSCKSIWVCLFLLNSKWHSVLYF